MWNLVAYVVLAFLISSLFYLAFGLSRPIVGRLLFRSRRAFFGYGVLVSTTVGGLYAAAIVLFTSGHVLRTGGSLWLYVPLSFVWGATLFRRAGSYQGVALASCMLGLLLSHAGLGILGPVVAWPMVAAVSLFYHLGGLWLVGSGSKQ